MQENHYPKLALSLFISFFVMYGVMFLNVDELDHIYLSLTRLYMTLLMVSPMAIIMLIVMKKMYSNKMLNGAIIASSTIVFTLSLICLRTQAFIGDTQYMKAMIPHHSSAIMTSTHAGIKNAEVRGLADSIIKSQRQEIQKMKSMLDKLDE
ncbi:DUF305 domain-containing protein [Mucilaginibacter sp. UR6-1]|uniref:DUF305 domain-containing protein n=1 Tax=Mucilaginibacter sp. UR6-1 TaxID=1435643 RepID=UPI001E5809B7|nr:DUF305 domain-containing protein [Mucilaginibacter sp. UR6-1]MCC8410770.1 DUF305 domain-containing protein [Mucilaginibacter sp. UR6-1]